MLKTERKQLILEELNQRFFIFIFGFPLSSFAKKDTTKESQTNPKADPIIKKRIQHLSHP